MVDEAEQPPEEPRAALDELRRQHEAQRVVSRRVHDEIRRLRHSGDLERLLRVIYMSLQSLQIPLMYCGANVIHKDGDSVRVTAHRMTAKGEWSTYLDVGVENVLHFYEGGEVVYRRDVWQDDPFDERRHFGPVRCVVDVPFSHGTLAVSSREPEAFSDADIEVLRDVADHLSDGFRRLEDLRALEERNRELEREVAERRRAEEQLAASLREKVVLLKEIHHRVKNNLQVISSLLNLQSHNTGDAEALAGFRESRTRIESMALIHEKLYESDDLARLDLGEYLEALADNVFDSYETNHQRVGLTVAVEAVQLDVDRAIQCGLIANELVSNSLKHAFPEGRSGGIAISLQGDDDGHAVLTVRDDGVGLPPGLDPERLDSLGLQLVCDLATQLEGQVAWRSEGGAVFEVRFPLKRLEVEADRVLSSQDGLTAA